MIDSRHVRGLFPLTGEYVVLDNAAVAPCPLPVAAALQEYLSYAPRDPDHAGSFTELIERAYERIARLLRVERRQLAFVETTTAGFLFLARSLPLEDGSVVVVPANEYPAVLLPWLERATAGRISVELMPVEDPPAGGVDVSDLARIIARPEVKLLCLSAVSWLGHRYRLSELRQLCLRYGVLLAVDGSQAVGMLDLAPAELGIDFLSTTFSKWAFGPEGIGCIYVSDTLRGRLKPVLTSAESAAVEPAHRAAPARLRFAVPPAPLLLATPSPLCATGLIAGLDLVLQIGLSAIERHVIDLASEVADLVYRAGYTLRGGQGRPRGSGIVTFSDRDAVRNPAVAAALRQRRVLLGLREGLLRLSVHIYNTREDIAAFGQALETLE